ncbi:unnamed protein product [Strongylus vulgaris]|uniref:Peptidase M10 metallopeptidase domain-containing protein n=1 Tax=Strongylus vulgaris TaxID=40348 RepID=A0A3P7JGI0_STRVU|nr:unnamed protein product [Strongylus vulgaris]
MSTNCTLELFERAIFGRKPGGVLAHATMPENGALHFDDDENWTYMDAKKIASLQTAFSGDYTDLLAVAMHEGGHTLGLSHSRDESSIMAPFYHETMVDHLGGVTLHNLQQQQKAGLEGSLEVMICLLLLDPTTTQRPNRPSFGGGDGGSSFGGSSGRGGSSGGTAACPYSVDAYTPSDAFSYLFSGSTVYALSGRKVHKSYRIDELFSSAPSHVDAAVFNPVSGMMLLFGNRQVYGYYYSRLRGVFQLDSAFPKRLPSDISFTPHGALRWINGHQILLSVGLKTFDGVRQL